MSDVHLSVVATSRNDDHGGRLAYRMEHFVRGLAAQCERHGVRAELVLVEWNPPQDRPPLVQALRWPARTRSCDIRVITVSADLHRSFQNADKIRLYQMLAKNVGIRRARGRYVVATNIDILFSDAAIQFVRDRLAPGNVYLADRVDVPAELPPADDFGAVLEYCGQKALRVNAGVLTVARGDAPWRGLDLLKTSVNARLGYFIHVGEQACMLAARTATNPRWTVRRLVGRGGEALAARGISSRSVGLPMRVARGALRVAGLTLAGVARAARTPSTNACGDFTLMARQDWKKVRGYAEWPVFSWHLDTLLVYQAIGNGMRIRRLPPAAPVFHIEHEGGYAPERAHGLFSSLKQRGIPFITDADLGRFHADFLEARRAGREVQVNETTWGLDGMALPEATP